MALVPYNGFIGGAYTARSKNFDAEECLNLYLEVAGVGTARTPAALYGCPGSRTWVTFPTWPVRGAHKFDSATAFVLSGGTVYRLETDGTFAAIGAVPGTDRVTFANNGVNAVVAASGNLYKIDPALDTVTQITDPDLQGAGQVGFLGGYYVWNVPGTGRSQYSDLYSTDVGGLSFFTAEGSPDDGVGVLVDHLEYWYFGELTTEVFGVTSDPDAPLQRISGAFIERGCVAAKSIVKLDNSIYWLGQDETGAGMVWRAVGYDAQRVSTHPIELALAEAGDISDADAWAYQQDGHTFYVLSVGDKTFSFDAATGLWHTRAWRDTDGVLHRVRGWCQLTFAGRTLVGDHETGIMRELRLDYYDDDGEPLVARRAGSYISARGYNMLQVDFETGVGLSSAPGADPQAMLEWSDDGGHTWSEEHWAPLGRMGEYQQRVRWRRLGAALRYGLPRMFRVTVTDPVKRAIISAMLDVTP